MSANHKLPIALLLALALCLSACGGASPSGSGAAGGAAWKPESVGQVGADERDVGPRDGLEGSYYNDYLRMLLQLDGRGGCTLTGGGVEASGSYAVSADTLTLDFGSRRETALVDRDGDVTIEGRSGYFLRNWSFWGITAEQIGAGAAARSETRETIPLGGGKQRFRDYENEIAFTYTEGIEVLPDRLVGAVAAADGADGYVTGRNVTRLLADFNGEPEDFLEQYIRTYTFADFDNFYGALTGFDPPERVSGRVKGRLAAATLRIRGTEREADVCVILYTSTYPDGTENFICKTYLAPAGDTARLKALESSVTDMSAVRMRVEH